MPCSLLQDVAHTEVLDFHVVVHAVVRAFDVAIKKLLLVPIIISDLIRQIIQKNEISFLSSTAGFIDALFWAGFCTRKRCELAVCH
jgi:hypothetical protein